MSIIVTPLKCVTTDIKSLGGGVELITPFTPSTINNLCDCNILDVQHGHCRLQYTETVNIESLLVIRIGFLGGGHSLFK